MAAERATLTDTDHGTQPSRYPVRPDIAEYAVITASAPFAGGRHRSARYVFG